MIPEFLIGFFSGVFSSLFGIGGAVVSTPLLRILLLVPGHIALGTPLPVVIPAALSALWVYRKSDLILYRPAVIIGIVASFSAILGARLTSLFSGSMMMLFTSLFLLLMALKLTIPVRIPRTERFNTKALIPIGLIVGLASGFLGIGGGAILIPLLLLAGLQMHVAVGTSLLAILIFAIPGSIQHYLLGNVSIPLMMPLAAGVIIGAQLGSRTSLSIENELLEKLFVIFLLILSVCMIAFELVTI